MKVLLRTISTTKYPRVFAPCLLCRCFPRSRDRNCLPPFHPSSLLVPSLFSKAICHGTIPIGRTLGYFFPSPPFPACFSLEDGSVRCLICGDFQRPKWHTRPLRRDRDHIITPSPPTALFRDTSRAPGAAGEAVETQRQFSRTLLIVVVAAQPKLERDISISLHARVFFFWLFFPRSKWVVSNVPHLNLRQAILGLV